MALLETPARLEPCQLPTYSEKLADLVSAVTASATTLGTRLHPLTASSLADLVRVMNCYYSHLIEGHDTRPRDIERALFEELETEPDFVVDAPKKQFGMPADANIPNLT